MSKIVFFVLISLLSSVASAVTIRVQNPCADTYWLEHQQSFVAGTSVGGLTINTLEAYEIPYLGTAAGISAIRNTPTGSAAIERLSDSHMRAYGWCFSINGVEPDKMPDQIELTADTDLIDWYFGFAEFKDGSWITYCTPTDTVKPDFICAQQ